jgi:hypothetical protein
MGWRDYLKVHPAADLFPMMSEAELQELSDDINERGMLNRPIVWNGDGKLWLLDGRSRLDAMELAGELTLRVSGSSVCAEYQGHPINFWLVDTDDPYGVAISLNICRRHLTGEQKRDLIAKLLKAAPEKSNRQIAQTVKADDKTVGIVRRDMERRAEIPHVETRTDTKGREQPATKPPPRFATSHQEVETKISFPLSGSFEAMGAGAGSVVSNHRATT